MKKLVTRNDTNRLYKLNKELKKDNPRRVKPQKPKKSESPKKEEFAQYSANTLYSERSPNIARRVLNREPAAKSSHIFKDTSNICGRHQ